MKVSEAKSIGDAVKIASRATTAQIILTEPSVDQARIRFDELARSVDYLDDVRVLHGFRRIDVGGLTIRVNVQR